MFVDTFACLLLAALTPQAPTPPAPTGSTPAPTETGIIAAARVLPGDAMLAFGLGKTSEHALDFADTVLVDQLQSLLQRSVLQTARNVAEEWLQERGDLHVSTFAACLATGGSAALRLDAKGRPEWILALPVAVDVEQLRHGLTRLAERKGDAPYSIAPPWLRGERVFAAVAEPWLLIGSSAEITGESMARAQANVAATASDSLATAPTYLAACDQALLTSQRPPLFTAWLDPQRAVAAALALAPAEMTKQASPWLATLGLTDLRHVTLTLDATKGLVEEQLLVGMPAPRSALFQALLPAGERPAAQLASLAPPGAESFAVTNVDLSGAWRELRRALTELQPEADTQLDQMVAGLRQQLGIDIERDLLLQLGGQLVSTSWRNADDRAVQLMVIEAERPDALDSALRGLVTHTPSRRPGFTVFAPQDGMPLPTFAVGARGLVVASEPAALDYWLSTQRGAVVHDRLAGLLANLPENATGLTWSATAGRTLADNLQFAPESLPTGTLPPEAFDTFQELRSQLGMIEEVHQQLVVDDLGCATTVHSKSGTVSLAMVAGLRTAIDMLVDPSVMEHMLGDARARQEATAHQLAGVLATLRDASRRFRASHGHFPGLDELLESEQGSSCRTLLGEARSRDTYALGDHLVATLGPDHPTATTGAHLVLLAWPDRAQRGTVVMTTDLLAPHRNDLLAQHDGLTTTSLHEVFVGGDFDAPLTPGWRPIELDASTAHPTAVIATEETPGAATSDRTLRAVIATLEARGADAAPQLAAHLDTADADLLARVIWKLGELNYADATEQIAAIAADEQRETQVRGQAFEALRKLGKVGGEPAFNAGVQVLDESDETVLRARAAGLLGALGDRRAIDPLIAFLAGEDDETSTDTDHGVDRAAAILALCDLGAVAELGEIAAAVEHPTATQSQALAFTWQNLSPRQEPSDEVVALVSVLEHESPLLRRFAIQRLGELENPRALEALEARLGSETDELRPLIEVSVTALRGALPEGDPSGAEPVSDLQKKVTAALQDPDVQIAAAGGLGGLVLMVVGLLWLRRRSRRRADAEQWASMVDPSEDFAEAGDETDYVDGEYVEDDAYQAQYPDGSFADDEGGIEEEFADAAGALFDEDHAPQSAADSDWDGLSDEAANDAPGEGFEWPIGDDALAEAPEDLATDDSWDETRR